MPFLSTYDNLTEPLAGSSLWVKTAGAIICSVALSVGYIVYRRLKWPAYTIPGPPYQSFLYGSAPSPLPPDFAMLYLHEGWFKKYGPTIRIWRSLARPTIMTIDPTALRHMLTSPAFEKGEDMKKFLGDVMGEGMGFCACLIAC